MAFAVALIPTFGFSASLPLGLTTDQARTAIAVVVPASSAKLLRSSEAYPAVPGIKVGVEVLGVPISQLQSFGTPGTSYLPDLLAVPRLFLAKGLFSDLEFGLTAFPFSLPESVVTYGGWLKWAWQKEELGWVASSFYAAYTNVQAFRSQIVANSYEAGISASKDLVRLKPYAGAGLLLSAGNVEATLMQAGAQGAHTLGTLHLFAGAEIELPANLALQIDLWNFSPSASLFLGARF